MVNEGTISCIDGSNVTTAQKSDAGDGDEWYVAGDLPVTDTLAAFAPEPPAVVNIDLPDPNRQPEVVINVEPPVVMKQGDFEFLGR